MAAVQLMRPELEHSVTPDDDYRQFISEFGGKGVSLTKPAGAVLKIATLEDTKYRDKPEEVNGWGKFYLPDIVDMKVVAVVEGTSSLHDQLVLMTCEDKKVYGYDGEELHVVASSLEQLRRTKALEYPASKSYYNGEAFEDMTEEDWAEVKHGEAGKQMDEEYLKFVLKSKNEFMKNLKAPGYV